jgi:peptidoglycan-associated lipoprotein
MFLRTLRKIALIALLASSSTALLYAIEPPPTVEPVYFDSDSSALIPHAHQQLHMVAKMMKDNPKLRVELLGFTDERGTSEYSYAIGEIRAKSVLNYLVQSGIARVRITVFSYGYERPRDPRHNKKAWAKNRRVEFVFRDVDDVSVNPAEKE